MNAVAFAGAAVGLTAIWLAAYRLPFADPRVRQRARLRVSSWTGIQPRYVFTILGTVMYLVLGAAATTVLVLLGGLDPLAPLRWQVSGPGAALTLLAGIGAGALTAFAMSVLHSLPGGARAAQSVSQVRWVAEILALPSRWRWPIPAASAALEEFYFRGVMLFGLLAAGAPVWLAIALPGLVFTAGQLVLTENRLQATVLGISSVVLSVICGLLTYVEASVVPAILIHASFAGYYTNLSAYRGEAAAVSPHR
jgi:hypothetical protein